MLFVLACVAFGQGVVGNSVPICPRGLYLDLDSIECRLCRAGYYGAVAGLTAPECSGECQAGYFCPEGSIQADARECGGAQYYCPRGSAAPLQVHDGYYSLATTVSTGLDTEASRRFRTLSSQSVCEPGYYCFRGIRRMCPAGVYGKTHGKIFESMDVISRHNRCVLHRCVSSRFLLPAKLYSPSELPCGKVRKHDRARNECMQWRVSSGSLLPRG